MPKAPKIWVLADDRPGCVTQAVGLAEALGWPYEVKQLAYSPLAGLHNVLLGASRAGLTKAAARGLAPPWPDLVIASGRRAAPPARWIARASQKRVRTVVLGRKGGHAADHFDLVVTPFHCGFPIHPRRIETVTALTRVSTARLEEGARSWPDLFGEISSPRVLLLVGGTTVRHRLDQAMAGRLGTEVASFARRRGGGVLAVTSRRTDAAAVDAIAAGLGDAGRMERWPPGRRGNPYLACLALAEEIVVTGESESMISEAVAADKPVAIYPLPERAAGPWLKLGAWIGARARAVADGKTAPRVLDRLCAWLVGAGVVRPPRELAAMHRRLVADGAVRMFGSEAAKPRRSSGGDRDEVVRRVRALLGVGRARRKVSASAKGG